MILGFILSCDTTQRDPIVEQAPIAHTDKYGQWFDGSEPMNMAIVEFIDNGGLSRLCAKRHCGDAK